MMHASRATAASPNDNAGNPFPASHYALVRDELTARFGGLTAYSRSPAEGLWDAEGKPPAHDDIVIYETLADELDRAWWMEFRERLERQFAQDELLIRSHVVERL